MVVNFYFLFAVIGFNSNYSKTKELSASQRKVAYILLSHPEVDVNAQDHRGWTALHWAAYNCDFEKAIRTLQIHSRMILSMCLTSK